jgi:hypothetical protein
MALSDRIYFDGAGVIKTYNPGGHKIINKSPDDRDDRLNREN